MTTTVRGSTDFTRGIGDHEVIVILEPDGIALTPTDCGQPDTFDRVALIRYAVATLGEGAPNASTYLDAGHNAWHNVGDISSRLVAAGVADAAGFYLNPSNYQFTENVVQYGTWISQCIAVTTATTPTARTSTGTVVPANWLGVALSPYGVWSDDSDDPALNTSGEINVRAFGATEGSTATSSSTRVATARDRGSPMDRLAGDPRTGATRPIAASASGRPGDTADRARRRVPVDQDPGRVGWAVPSRTPAARRIPARGMIDPAAGQWFPEMALELVHNASPAP